jgi:hypothetical protein
VHGWHFVKALIGLTDRPQKLVGTTIAETTGNGAGAFVNAIEDVTAHLTSDRSEDPWITFLERELERHVERNPHGYDSLRGIREQWLGDFAASEHEVWCAVRRLVARELLFGAQRAGVVVFGRRPMP